MCGIAGYVWPSGSVAPGIAMLRQMCDSIAHRGPDDSGTYVDDVAGLGMRRLSIIDVEGGHQPMASEDGQRHLVFNGEIYNYRELRSALEQRGKKFRTASDTEVLLRQLEADGLDALRHLNGMFAFALWDATRRRLMLARDRLGVKPLYYAWYGGKLIFASELKALIAVAVTEKQLDEQALWDYLTFRYIPPPYTIWRNIHKLPPAHMLVLDANSTPRVSRYWDIPYTKEPRHRNDPRDDREFAELFTSAVRLRLVADVPVGVLLSGGLDSSAVAAATVAAGARLETFSIGFAESPQANELPFARTVAKHLGNPHSEVTIGQRQYCDFLPEFVRHIDEPMADPAAVPLYFVCKLAAERVKVVLSGEGSDEVLGGYDFDLWVEMWERQRAAIERVAIGFRGRLRQLLSGTARHKPVDLRRAWPPPNMTNYMTSEQKKRLFGGQLCFRESMNIIARDLERLGPQPPLHQIMYVFSQSWLSEDLLMKADKMSMANSVELRTPFLDYRLVEWAANTTPEAKVGPDERGRLVTKRALRRFAKGLLPSDIIERPKQGFPVPVFDWLGTTLRDFADGMILGAESQSRRLFDPHELREIVATGFSNSAALLDRHRLWNLLVLELWLREWQPT